VPTDPSTGRATIGGRARRDSGSTRAASADTGTGTGQNDALGHPSQAAPAPAPTESIAPAPRSVPPAASTTAATATTSIDDSQIPSLFETQVRPVLRGMAKAIYMGAHVGTMSGGALVISFAGEPHRVRAEEYRRDVEKALAAAAGRVVALSLVVDQGESHDDNVVQLKRAEPVQADEDIDTGDLVDVPPDAIVSPIDRLTQAFPGSEIIEERT
jgi:DNA polymerase-3 subunit gamma/tau